MATGSTKPRSGTAERRQAFAQAYIANGHNATQAAIEAGYTPTAIVTAAVAAVEVGAAVTTGVLDRRQRPGGRRHHHRQIALGGPGRIDTRADSGQLRVYPAWRK
jgi:hypothetical protein